MGCSLLLWWPFSLCRRQLLAVEDLKFFQFTRADIFDMRPRFVLLFFVLSLDLLANPRCGLHAVTATFFSSALLHERHERSA